MRGRVSSLRCWISAPRIGLKPPPCDVAAPVDVQLLQNVMHVILDRRGTEAQSPSDFFVGQIARDQRRDLSFPRCQHGVSGPRRSSTGESRQPAEEESGGPRRALQFAFDRAQNRCDQILYRSVLCDITRDPRLAQASTYSSVSATAKATTRSVG